MNKSDIRILVQEKISHMSKREKENDSNIIYTKLVNILSGKEFQTIVAYHAFADEVDISKIGEWCHNNWKNMVAVPQSTETFEVPNNSIILVPGRAFTRDGQRIGRWSGYYDKLITLYPNSQTIGICFDCQIFEKLPEDNWDKRMDKVVFPSIELE